MKVRKENRVLSVDEADKAFYLSEGYDIVELADNGKEYVVVDAATGGKTYSIAEYAAVVKERDALAAEKAELTAEIEDLKKGDFDRAAATAKLKELGVQFKGNASNDTLKQLLEDSTKKEGDSE